MGTSIFFFSMGRLTRVYVDSTLALITFSWNYFLCAYDTFALGYIPQYFRIDF